MITMVSRAGRVWAVIVGLVEIAAAFGHAEAAGTRALFILGGLITVAYLGDAAMPRDPSLATPETQDPEAEMRVGPVSGRIKIVSNYQY